MSFDIVIGGVFGDEGKGKIFSYLAIKDKADICVRGTGGANAGHTVKHNGKIMKLRIVPSGVINKSAKLYLSSKVNVNPVTLKKEIEETGCQERLFLDHQTSIISPEHIEYDTKNNKIGTTGTGQGPANADRAFRTMKLARDYPDLKFNLTNVSQEIYNALKSGKHILGEGSQGTFLSLYHGFYPYVTSQDVSASGFLSGIGIGPKMVREIILVFKAYNSKVGAGPFPTEKDLSEIPDTWKVGEIGTVTQRARRLGTFDYKLAKRSCEINSATMIALTCIDKVFPENKGVTNFEDLCDESKLFIHKIETETGVKIKLIGTGPDSNEIIDLR